MSKTKICKWCGKEFERVGKEQFCGNECRKEADRLARHNCYKKRKQREKSKPKESKQSTLNEKIPEANRRGISYGQLMAEKYIDSIRERKTL